MGRRLSADNSGLEFLLDWFRIYHNPLRNRLGFGEADFVELAAVALLVLLVALRGPLERLGLRFAGRTRFCMAGLAMLTIGLRLGLLPHSPVPIPSGADDFAHVLAADTLRHFRFANALHPMHRFFETVFVLQEPTYSSIYPMGPGLAMALGWLLFGHPWAGVLLSMAAFSCLCYWMLRGWTTPGWALLGGLLGMMEFGPLRYWTNTYWGGGVSAIAGCLIFGSLPRLRESGRPRDAMLLGIGLGLQLLCRPFEAALLLPCVAVSLFRYQLRRATAIAVLATIPAVAMTLVENRQVTGSWTTLPYELSRYQYGIPTTFTVQANPVPHRALTQSQQLDYDAQAAVHGRESDSVGAYLGRLGQRVRFYRFFLLAPLYVVMPVFLLAMRERRWLWVGLTLGVLALGTNFYPYFYPHYIAAGTCLFVLAPVIGLERVSRLTIRGRPAGLELSRMIVVLCGAHFLFWYGFHLFGNKAPAAAMIEYDTWDFVNHGDPESRNAIRERLANAGGKQLVFVRYWPTHRFDEWIQNAADIDAARVVWALDLGAAENEKLRKYYPDRKSWLLEPDARPPRLAPISDDH